MAYWDRKSNEDELLLEIADKLRGLVEAIDTQQRLLFLQRLGPFVDVMTRWGKTFKSASDDELKEALQRIWEGEG
jgi:hypothetical protein